jgi:nucleoside-diphosphate-sugar epimerase
MRTCLVTGATGFIGSHAIRDLSNSGWKVHALLRNPIGLPAAVVSHVTDGTYASICAALRSSTPDVVIHLATCYLKDHEAEQIDEMIASNITFGTRLLEAMWETDCARLITAGTAWQHLESQGDEYRPATLYAATKQAFEDIARWYADARGFAITSLHFGDTYGPKDPRPKIFSMLAAAARDGTPLLLSPGQQRLDPLYVTDAVRALEVAALRNIQGFSAFRVSPGKPISLRDMVGIWCNVNNLYPDLRWGSKPYREREVMQPWQGGVSLPGWQAVMPLQVGLSLVNRDG